MLSSKAKGASCLVASAFGFALMALCVRLCDDYGAAVSSFQKSFFRNVVALVIALTVFLRSRHLNLHLSRNLHPFPPPLTYTSLFLLLTRSIVGTIGIFANFYALSHIPIAEGQTLNKTAPFFTIFFAFLFLRERIALRQIVALITAFAGVLLIAKPGFAGEATFPLAMGLMGGAMAGAAYACVRALRKRGVESSVIVLFFCVFSCLASVPFMLAHFDPMTGVQVLILFGAGAGAALGQFGVTLAYGYAAPRDIAVYDYTNILFTAAFGFVFFGQSPDVLSLIGFVAIVLAAFRLH